MKLQTLVSIGGLYSHAHKLSSIPRFSQPLSQYHAIKDPIHHRDKIGNSAGLQYDGSKPSERRLCGARQSCKAVDTVVIADSAAIVTVPDGFEHKNVGKGAGCINGTKKDEIGRYAVS